MKNNFKDFFSKNSAGYAKYRPTYPRTLFDYLASLVREHKCAWDCATGNGQSASMLVDYFDKVIATDPSEEQLDNAILHPKIEYRVATAEDSKISEKSIDLITVAQAFHWINQEKFLKEVIRVAKQKCILAIWCYKLAHITKDVDEVIYRLYTDILGNYWDDARKMVDDGYKNINFPFQKIESPTFDMSVEWDIEGYMGYLGTWSALQKYISVNSKNPLNDIGSDLKKAWGPGKRHKLHWDLELKVWKI